jgi:hypothetical protein
MQGKRIGGDLWPSYRIVNEEPPAENIALPQDDLNDLCSLNAANHPRQNA